MFYIKMVGLYLRDHITAYYRKQGIYCFDFVTRKELASPLTAEECDAIMKNADWYCDQFSAMRLEVEAA